MVSRTLEERLAKAKKAVRDTRWWVVVFKYCIEAVLMVLLTFFLSFVMAAFPVIDSFPNSVILLIMFIFFLLCALPLNAIIRWMF